MNSAVTILVAILTVANAHTLYTIGVVSPSTHVTPLQSHSTSSVNVNTPHYNYNYGLSQTKNHGAVISYGHTLVPISYVVPEEPVVHQPQPQVRVTYNSQQQSPVIQAQTPAKVTSYNYNSAARQPQQHEPKILTFPSYVYTYTHPGHYVGVHTSTLQRS